MTELILIFISTILVNNFVLHYFLGICPFLGVSGKNESSLGMGMAVTFVMTLATSISWLIYHLVLVKWDLIFLQYVIFILVIASLVQVVDYTEEQRANEYPHVSETTKLRLGHAFRQIQIEILAEKHPDCECH